MQYFKNTAMKKKWDYNIVGYQIPRNLEHIGIICMIYVSCLIQWKEKNKSNIGIQQIQERQKKDKLTEEEI